MEEKKSTQVSSDTVTMSKADFDSLQASIASLKGLGDLVKSQSEEIKTLKAQVETASAQARNATNAITNAYVQPVKIPSGQYPYLKFTAKVAYTQADKNGNPVEREKDFDIVMPKPCGRLNSVKSELYGRIIPRIMREEGIINYIVSGISYVEDKVKTEMVKPEFAGKHVVAFTAKDCEEFAIIYEALSVPVNASIAVTRQAVAQEWAYVMYDCPHKRQLVVNGQKRDKMQQVVELVDYAGARQEYPELERVSPSQFREMAEAAKETESK